MEYRTLCGLASVICMHLHYPSLGTLILLKDLCMTSFTHGNMIKLKVIQVYMTLSFVELPPPGFTMKCSYSLPELLASIQLCTFRFTKSISSPLVSTLPSYHWLSHKMMEQRCNEDGAHTCLFNIWEADTQESLGDTEFLASLGHRPSCCLKQQRVLET